MRHLRRPTLACLTAVMILSGGASADAVARSPAGRWASSRLSFWDATIASSPDQSRSVVVWADPHCRGVPGRAESGCVDMRQVDAGMVGPARLVASSQPLSLAPDLEATIANDGSVLVVWQAPRCCIRAASRAAGRRGFGSVTAVSVPGENVASFVTAVSPDGRTGIVWQAGPAPDDGADLLQAAFGTAGGGLTRPQLVPSPPDTSALSLTVTDATAVADWQTDDREEIGATVRTRTGAWSRPQELGALADDFPGVAPFGDPLRGLFVNSSKLVWRRGNGPLAPLGPERPVPFSSHPYEGNDQDSGAIALDPSRQHALLVIDHAAGVDSATASFGVATASPGAAAGRIRKLGVATAPVVEFAVRPAVALNDRGGAIVARVDADGGPGSLWLAVRGTRTNAWRIQRFTCRQIDDLQVSIDPAGHLLALVGPTLLSGPIGSRNPRGSPAPKC